MKIGIAVGIGVVIWCLPTPEGVAPEAWQLLAIFVATIVGIMLAPVLFGAGYVSLRDWWKLGAVVSVVNIVIWIGIGGCWWKITGLW